MLQNATFRYVGGAALILGAFGVLAGCHISPGDIPPLVRNILTKPSPRARFRPRVIPRPTASPSFSAPELTARQIKRDLRGLHFSIDGGGTWYFESDKEFRTVDILGKETAGRRETYAVHLDLVGDPNGEEVQADGHLNYLRSGNRLIFQSMRWEKSLVVGSGDNRYAKSDDGYIGREPFPSGASYHRTETQTYQIDDGAPARLELDTDIDIAEQTDSYQKLRLTQNTTLLSKGDLGADETLPFPENEAITHYQTRYNNGTTQSDGPEEDQDDFVPKDRIAEGSTWQGTLHLTDKHSVQVDAEASRFETYAGRRAVVVDISNRASEDIDTSGQIILDCATGLPLHVDLHFEIAGDDDKTLTVTFESEGKFTP